MKTAEKASHTPGPWKLMPTSDKWGNYWRVSTEQGQMTFDLPNEANARLIAAAPEMLQALERALDWLPGLNECCDDEREELGLLHIDIKAAIRKAKGEL